MKTETTGITEDHDCKYVAEVESSTSCYTKTPMEQIFFLNLELFNKRFICPQSKHEIKYCDSYNVTTTTNCCPNKMQIDFLIQDLKSTSVAGNAVIWDKSNVKFKHF